MILGPKIYTAHIRPQDANASETPVFVKEGFNFWAFVLTLFWALYHRLWLPALAIFVANILLLWALKAHCISPYSMAVLHLAIHIVCGFHGNDWIRARLARKAYILADIAVGDSRLRAEQRYFERTLAA